MGHIQLSRLIPASTNEIYSHICDLGNLAFWLRPQLDMEWPGGEIPEIRENGEIALFLARLNVALKVSVQVEKVVPGQGYTYRQVRGLFQFFRHTQIITAHDEKTSLLTDLIDFRLPLGLIGSLLDDVFFRKDLESILNARLLRIEKHFQSPNRQFTEPVVSL